MMKKTQVSHSGRNMNFRRIGGSSQLVIRSATDLKAVLELDEALWAINSIEVTSVCTNQTFLNYLDDDHNGVIRADEVKRAIRFLLEHLRDYSGVDQQTDSLTLTAINDDTPNGAGILAAARLVLLNIDQSDQKHVTLTQVLSKNQIIGRSGSNGDGIITPASTESEEQTQLLQLIMKSCGSRKDLSGLDGIDASLLNEFETALQAQLNWRRQPQEHPELLPYGTRTGELAALVAAVEPRINQYFLSTGALEFLSTEPDRRKNLLNTDLMNPQEVENFLKTVNLAEPRPDGMLDFAGSLNPVDRPALLKLAAQPEFQIFLTDHKLSLEQWNRFCQTLQPYRNWFSAKPEKELGPIDFEVLEEQVKNGVLNQLRELIAADVAVAGRINSLESLCKLILFQRYLLNFLNNYVGLAQLFNPKQPSMLQTGKLIMDGRHFTLANNVKNIAEHKKIAIASDICVIYVEISTGTPAALQKQNLAVAVTSGEMRNLFIGKRGIFITPDQLVWDAKVIDFIEQPVSITEALRMPFYRFGEFLGKQADKFFTAKSNDAQKSMEKNISNATLPLPDAGKAQTPAISGSMLLMGGGIGIAAIGSSVAFIVKSLQNVSILNVLAVLFGILLIFGGPVVIVSLVKLYRRNISRFLEANACAVNRRMRLSGKMGSIFTFSPELPGNLLHQQDLVDLFHATAPHRRRLRRALLLSLAIILVIAAAVYFWRRSNPATIPQPPPAAETETVPAGLPLPAVSIESSGK